MKDEKLLSEEKYQKNNKKVKKVGKIILIVGIIIFVISCIIFILGFLGFGKTAITGVNAFNNDEEYGSQIVNGMFGSFGLFAISIIINFIGLVLTIIGGVLLFISHRREITAYTTQQVMPVAQEGIEKITPTISDAAGSIAKSISKGINEGKNEANNTDRKE